MPKAKPTGHHDRYPYTLALTRDVLVIEVVLLDGRYPSANQSLGGAMRFSAKNATYRTLFNTIVTAGQDACARGWRTVAIGAEYRVVRIAKDQRVRDASNLGSAEANALTAAGVWTDDCIAAPVHFDVQQDKNGPDRVVITVTRQHARNNAERPARPAQPRRRRGAPATPKPAESTDGRYAYLNGVRVPFDDAMKLIQ